MAGLLRHGAARRLAGSMIQRPHGSSASPRLIHTKEQAHRGIEREIQQKIEELYDLIVEGEKDDRTSSWSNAWLVQRLSEEVTPRPSDSFLHVVQKTRSVYSGIRRAGRMALIFLSTDYYLYGGKVSPPVMTMEEEHEAEEGET